MKKLAMVLLSTVMLSSALGQNTVIKLQQTGVYTWRGAASLPGLTNVAASISRTPPGNGMYSVQVSPNSSGVDVFAKIQGYVPPDPPGALNLKVGEVAIKQLFGPGIPPQEILRCPVVLDNPYYVRVSVTEQLPDVLATVTFHRLPDTPQVIGSVSDLPWVKFVRWSGLAVDLGCVQDRIKPGTLPGVERIHECVVDVKSYFERANTQCYITGICVRTTFTPGGQDVTVLLPGGSAPKTATLGFSEVIEPGFTALVPSESGPGLPTGFRLGSPPRYYDITTTAVYSGPINVCISYGGLTFGPGALRLLHYEGGQWVDCTTNVDTINQVVCGVVDSLSPFVVAERTTIPVEIDIKPGSYPNSFNRNSHGVIPVAILGSADFDVTQIDAATLGLGSLTLRVKNNGQLQCAQEDVNGDGCPDLVCQFADDGSLAGQGTTTVTLTGSLREENGATPLEGSDEIRLVP